MILTEVLGTKYLSTNWLQDIRYLVDNLVKETQEEIHTYEKDFRETLKAGEPYVIDLAGARICKDVMTYICGLNEPKIKFIDSANESREALLRENERRRTLSYETTQLPELTDLNDLVSYLPALDSSIVYTIGDMPIDEAVRLVTIITLYRPDIKIDMQNKYEYLFQYVASLFRLSNYKCDKVLYIVGSTFAEAEVKDNKVYIVGYGNMDWNVFINTFTCLPYEFGTEFLAQNPEWREVLVKCCTSLPSYLKHRPTITDYFKMEV